MGAMSTGHEVKAHLDKAVAAHRTAHHHAVSQARAARRARAAVEAAGSPEQVELPDLEPEGLPAGPPSIDLLAGL